MVRHVKVVPSLVVMHISKNEFPPSYVMYDPSEIINSGTAFTNFLRREYLAS